jgi:hypothetical protein
MEPRLRADRLGRRAPPRVCRMKTSRLSRSAAHSKDPESGAQGCDLHRASTACRRSLRKGLAGSNSRLARTSKTLDSRCATPRRERRAVK